MHLNNFTNKCKIKQHRMQNDKNSSILDIKLFKTDNYSVLADEFN